MEETTKKKKQKQWPIRLQPSLLRFLQTVKTVANFQDSCKPWRQLQTFKTTSDGCKLSIQLQTVSNCQCKCKQLQTIADLSVFFLVQFNGHSATEKSMAPRPWLTFQVKSMKKPTKKTPMTYKLPLSPYQFPPTNNHLLHWVGPLVWFQVSMPFICAQKLAVVWQHMAKAVVRMDQSTFSAP